MLLRTRGLGNNDPQGQIGSGYREKRESGLSSPSSQSQKAKSQE